MLTRRTRNHRSVFPHPSTGGSTDAPSVRNARNGVIPSLHRCPSKVMGLSTDNKFCAVSQLFKTRKTHCSLSPRSFVPPESTLPIAHQTKCTLQTLFQVHFETAARCTMFRTCKARRAWWRNLRKGTHWTEQHISSISQVSSRCNSFQSGKNHPTSKQHRHKQHVWSEHLLCVAMCMNETEDPSRRVCGRSATGCQCTPRLPGLAH